MTSTVQLADRWQRLVATLIDMILVPFLSIILVMVFDVMEDAEDFQDRLWILWTLLTAILAYLILNGYWLFQDGQTIGKKLMGIRIVSAKDIDATERPAPAALWKLIVLRAPFFPLLFIGLVPWFSPIPILDQISIFAKQRRCLHDYVSGTIVVRAT